MALLGVGPTVNLKIQRCACAYKMYSQVHVIFMMMEEIQVRSR